MSAQAGTGAASAELDFDPLAEDPYPFYERARREAPVVYSERLRAWLVTRYADIVEVLKNPEVFSSRDALTSPVQYAPEALEELIKGVLPVPIVLNTDGEDHARFRGPLMAGFSVARMKAFEPHIRRTARRLIDELGGRGRAEMVSQFAYPLALEVILDLLGVPAEDVQAARTWSQNWLMLMSVQMEAARQVACARSTVEFQRYLAGLVDDRRGTPKEDLISSLAAAKEAFTDQELIVLLQGLILAGHESTTNMIGTGLVQLLKRRRLWQALCEDPARIPSAVEEVLRFDAPIQMFVRTAVAEARIGKTVVPQDAAVLVLYGSGNHDEAAFDEPAGFQPARQPNRHLAFGHGVHFCVAAALARLEGRVAFEELTARLPGLRLLGGQTYKHLPTLLFRGYEEINVEW